MDWVLSMTNNNLFKNEVSSLCTRYGFDLRETPNEDKDYVEYFLSRDNLIITINIEHVHSNYLAHFRIGDPGLIEEFNHTITVSSQINPYFSFKRIFETELRELIFKYEDKIHRIQQFTRQLNAENK